MRAAAGTRAFGSRRRTFACFMGGFLLTPFIPFEFTSILTAMVWSFSGAAYAAVFAVAGTFLRPDSLTIYSGIQLLLSKAGPVEVRALSEPIAISVMFLGNLCTAYIFKAFIRHKVANRLPAIYTLA